MNRGYPCTQDGVKQAKREDGGEENEKKGLQERKMEEGSRRERGYERDEETLFDEEWQGSSRVL